MSNRKTEYVDFSDNDDIDSIGNNDLKSSVLMPTSQSSSFMMSPLMEQRKVMNRAHSMSPGILPRSMRKHVEDPIDDKELHISALKKKLVSIITYIDFIFIII